MERLNILEFLIKFMACFGTIAITFFAVILFEKKCYRLICGSDKYIKRQGSILGEAIAQIIRLFSKSDYHIYKKGPLKSYFSVAACFAIGLVFFIAVPFFEPFMWNGKTIYPEYYHMNMGILFVLLVQVFGQLAIYIIQRGTLNYFQEVLVVRDFVNYISSKAFALLALLPIFAIYGTLEFHEVVQKQVGHIAEIIPSYGIFLQPISAALFFIYIQIESGTGSFNFSKDGVDLGRSHYGQIDGRELVLLEFVKKSQWLSLIILYIFIFLGGYSPIPGVRFIAEMASMPLYFIQGTSLFIKIILMVFILTLVTHSFSRFRSHDVTNLILKKWIPLAFVNFLVTLGYMFYQGFVR